MSRLNHRFLTRRILSNHRGYSSSRRLGDLEFKKKYLRRTGLGGAGLCPALLLGMPAFQSSRPAKSFRRCCSPSLRSPHPSYTWRMDLKRRARKKPWMATSKGRTSRSPEDGSLNKPFKGTKTQSNPLYRTAEWLATRDAVLHRDALCVWCLACGIATEATDADHIIPATSTESRSSFFDQDNIVGSCRSCNSRRASYSAKGIYFETKKEWEDFLRRKHFRKTSRT